MLNSFRSKDKDTFIIFGFLCLVTVPFIIISLEKFHDFSTIFAVIYFVGVWNFIFSGFISAFLYKQYIVYLDNGLKIRGNRRLTIFINILFILVYCVNVYLIIFYPSEMHSTVVLNMVPFFIMQSSSLRSSIVIGETYLTNSRQTIRLDSIKSMDRSRDESLSGLSLISIKLKDDKEMSIRGSKDVYKLICEKANIV